MSGRDTSEEGTPEDTDDSPTCRSCGVVSNELDSTGACMNLRVCIARWTSGSAQTVDWCSAWDEIKAHITEIAVLVDASSTDGAVVVEAVRERLCSGSAQEGCSECGQPASYAERRCASHRCGQHQAEPVFAVAVETVVYVRGGPDFARRVREAAQRIDPERLRLSCIDLPTEGHVGGVPFRTNYETRCDEDGWPAGPFTRSVEEKTT